MVQSIRGKDDTAELFCLAVLALISMQLSATHPSTPSEYVLPTVTRAPPNDDHRGSRPSARSYFTSKRAYQTLNLVVLKAAIVCSASCSLSVGHIVEQLHLSKLVIEAIDITERSAWVEKERQKGQKLIEKILVCGSRLEVRDALLLDESSIREQLLSLLQTATDCHVNSKTMLKIRGALVIAKSLAVSVETSASLREHFLYILSLDALAAPLDRLLSSSSDNPTNHIDHDHCDTCPYLYAEQQLDLQRTICTLFLKTSLFAQQDEASLDPQIGAALLDKITSMKVSLHTCIRYTNNSHNHVSLSMPSFEDKGMAENTAASRDWRSRIKTQLSRNVDQQFQSIARTLGEACGDLERRCSEIEKPLRNEQAKSSQLHAALEESRMRAQDLISHSHEQSMIMEALEEEKSGWGHIIGDKERIIREQSRRVEELLREVHQANVRTEDATQKCRDRVKELELLHATSLAEKQETLESEHQKKQEIEIRLGEAAARAARLQAENDMGNRETSRLRAVSTEQKTIIHEAQALVSEKQVQLDQQRQFLNRLQGKGERMESEIERLLSDCSGKQADLEDKIVAMGRHNMMAELQHHSETRIQRLQATMKEDNEAAIRHARESNARIRHLEDKLARTMEELKAREEDLEEAKELQDQITAFVNNPRRRDASSEAARAVNDDLQLDLGTSRGANSPQKASLEPTKTNTSPRYLVSTSHARGTPRPSITANTPTICRKAVSFRPPFRDITAGIRAELNMSSARGVSSQKNPGEPVDEHSCRENLDSEMGEASFWSSDFCASTDQHLIAEHLDMPNQNDSEDITAEF
ncbi:MAG: hypothetical protein Q9174_001274 [Haloplaca sp. 1 TL-2023]